MRYWRYWCTGDPDPPHLYSRKLAAVTIHLQILVNRPMMVEILILQLLVQLLRNATITKGHNSHKLVLFTTQNGLESKSSAAW
jgi:hypothetical protein